LEVEIIEAKGKVKREITEAAEVCLLWQILQGGFFRGREADFAWLL
jgi:hypothetical protein